jgi:carbonic anhydrase/acetyltransferase-like protein (isoleucine patch superfamily)
MPLLSYNGRKPKIGGNVFIAENAFVIGDVEIGCGSSIWYNCVIRGDVNSIRIGKKTNIQDGSVIHVASQEPGATIIGDNVTIGHAVLIHACHIADYSFIGMRATIMDRAYVDKFGWIGAGALITADKRINSGELWVGVPGKFFRNISDKEKGDIKKSSTKYFNLAQQYFLMQP